MWKDGIVTVLDQNVADGWWKGDLNGKIGVFPANVRSNFHRYTTVSERSIDLFFHSQHVKLVESMEEDGPNAEAKTKSEYSKS